ncbi:MAG: nickel pincer cofactor biosynthesis protein LarC, partial [Microlunatus sp.]|nr:nickel pincer cofactor biosynthesis protein LarC [Microlunatus sp.]
HATAVFARLARAEAEVHGSTPEEIHFHEVGALDSIADVVGVCAGLHDLGIGSLTGSRVAVGSGTVRAAHGRIPVPVPAVTWLATGWEIIAGGEGELTTPTGMALLATLCADCTDLPALRMEAVGLGAGTKDFDGRANVTRILIGEPASPDATGDPAILIEANVDDLDPRLWPGVLADLLAAGASDAWLVPITMKKGRPAHTLTVLAHPSAAAGLRELIFNRTTTIGVRQQDYHKFAMPRAWVKITITGGDVMIKLAHRDGVIEQATPEFDDVAAIAATTGRPTRTVLSEAIAAAWSAGLRPGDHVPEHARSTPQHKTTSVSPEASPDPTNQEENQ